MQGMSQAVRAYGASAGRRNWREQEADVFRRATGALRAAQLAGPLERTRALADNRRLWTMVVDMVIDPDNALPAPLRAGIVSVGMTVQREMDRPEPNFDFLIGVNENIAAGLAGEA